MNEVVFIPRNKLKIADYNPREAREPEILNAIKETSEKVGILEPLLVRKLPDETYEVFQGGTRLLAAKSEQLPCKVFDVDEKTAFRLATISHFLHEDLTPLEKGKHIKKGLKLGVWKNVEDVAKDLGVSEQTVYRWLKEVGVEEVKVELPVSKKTEKKLKEILEDMPKDVRKAVQKEIEETPPEILKKVEDELPSVLKIVKKEADEPDEAIKKYRACINKTIEKEEKVVKTKGPSGYGWEVFTQDKDVVIFKYERETLVERIKIPRSDLKTLIELLRKWCE